MTICSFILIASLAADAGPSIVAELGEGPPVSGRWVSADSTSLTMATDAGTRDLRLDSLTRIRFVPQPPATSQPASGPWWVVFEDGSELSATVAGEAAARLTVTTGYGELSLPLTAIAGLRPSGPADAEFAKAIAARGPEDQYLVRQGANVTVLRGMLERLGPGRGSFRWKDRSVPVDASRTAGLVLRAAASQPAGGGALCRLNSGEHLRGRLDSADAVRVRWSVAVGSTLDLPIGHIAEIDFAAGAGLYLSDLQPVSYQHTPAGAARWPWRKDRNAANRPMRIAGRAYDRGLGLHSPCVIAYDLPAGAQRLTAVAGIDDAARPRGRVELRISLDGREAFRSLLAGDDQPLAIDLQLAGAKRLEVSIGDAGDLDTGDQLNVADPMVALAR